MKFGNFEIDEVWSHEKIPRISSWYRTIHGEHYTSELDFTVYHSDICVIHHFSNDYWYLYFQHYIFREEYIMMYGEDFEFPTLELGKDRVDQFLDKLIKLKVFL